MTQVVQTIRTFQTADGPSVEARISDPDLGDVRLIVTGRAGEVVQAQLVVRDRVSADALTQAAARVHATSDALAGVSVTVRSESGGSSTTGGRAGGNAFESAAWNANGGYGTGAGQGGRNGQGQDLGAGNAAGSGTATGSGPGMGSGPGTNPGPGSNDASRNAPLTAPVLRPETTTANRTMPRSPLPGGPSLDIRA